MDRRNFLVNLGKSFLALSAGATFTSTPAIVAAVEADTEEAEQKVFEDPIYVTHIEIRDGRYHIVQRNIREKK